MCTMFDGFNYKYAGVCYNNIANLQFKNKKYKLAQENYKNAIQLADIALKKIEPEDFYRSKKIVPKKIESLNVELEPQDYFRRVRAHRYYQFVMCRYKMLKYHDSQDQNDEFSNSKLNQDEESLLRPDDQRNSSLAEKWINVDSMLQQAISNYYELKSEVNGTSMTTFIDLILRLTLCRVYANNQSSKILTAEKLLGFAEKIIQALKDEKNPLVIVGSKTDIVDRKRSYQFDQLLKQR